MRIGDQVFLYQSNRKSCIVGTWKSRKVIRLHCPGSRSHYFDPKSTPQNPRWFMVDVKLCRRFKRLISLKELKDTPEIADMLILRKGNRLSVTPVQPQEWQAILGME